MKALSFLMTLMLLGCAADRAQPLTTEEPAQANRQEPVAGQETHGGDLAVAMARSALMKHRFTERADVRRVSEIMTRAATSENRGSQAPLFSTVDGLIEVNRDRLDYIEMNQIPYELFGPIPLMNFIISDRMDLPYYLGNTMTPKLFREHGVNMLPRLSRCLQGNPMYFLPDFTEEEIADVEVAWADKPLFDSKTKRRVDVGVVLDSAPRILMDRERLGRWTEFNYGTDYLVFHEYAHVILSRSGRSDSDHLLAALLFYECSGTSAKFRVGERTPPLFEKGINTSPMVLVAPAHE